LFLLFITGYHDTHGYHALSYVSFSSSGCYEDMRITPAQCMPRDAFMVHAITGNGSILFFPPPPPPSTQGRVGAASLLRGILSVFSVIRGKNWRSARKSSVVRDDRCALLQSTWTIGVDGSTSRLATDIVLRTGRSVTLPSRWMSKFDVDVVRKDSHQSRMCRWSLPSASWSGRRMNSVHQPQDLR
jgi:hypothetical protein